MPRKNKKNDPIDITAYCDEILRRFPEIVESWVDEDEEQDPGTFLSYIVWWLRDLGVGGITPEIEQRVVSLARWCESSPSGETGENDLYTQFVVSFFEDLFSSEVTRPLIPKIYDYDHMMTNADYLIQWVGQGDFELALKEFKEHDGRDPRKRQ